MMSGDNASKGRSHLHLSGIIESAIEGIITINQSGEILSMNPSAERLFGYLEKETVYKNIQMLMPEPYKSEHDGYISNYLLSQKPKIIGKAREVIGLRKNGQEFPMWLSVIEFCDNNTRYFTGFISDLSAEKANLQKALNYEHILESSLSEIYIFNADTLKFIHINKGALLNLQYSFEDLKNKSPVDIKPEFTDETFRKRIAPLKDNDLKKLLFTTWHLRKDGSTYPIEVYLEMTEFENQKSIVAFIVDISERISAQERARENENQLAHLERLSIIGEMTAGIAHEINQPLAAINTYANAGIHRLDRVELDVTKLKQLFDKIGDASHRVSEIITHLRSMLKPRSKQIEHLDINRVIHETIEFIQVDARSNNFHFNLKLSESLPKILGDPIQLQQVITNLIRNSMDATIIKNNQENEIMISSEELIADKSIKVSIRDSGCGIDSKVENNIFSPFYTTKESGLGIGLSICQAIIQSHNGRLWHTKNSDSGVTFHFTLHAVLAQDNE
jgi:two-component system sensor kinase FixL